MMNEFNTVQRVILWAVPVLFAITLHEVAHGWAANKFGDKTALMLGRITLNPLKHIDPIGTLLIPGILLILGGFVFGWAKPVPVNSRNLNHPKRDMIFVAAAGPIANLFMAIAWAFVIKLGFIFAYSYPMLSNIFIYMGQAGVAINLVLMVLNLIPIPPLDGGRVLSGLLPNRYSNELDRLEPYGFFIILLLLMTGVLGAFINPVVMSFMQGFAAILGF